MDRRGPLGVAGLVRVQQVGEFFRLRIPLGIGKQGVRLDERHLRIAFHGSRIKRIELLDLLG